MNFSTKWVFALSVTATSVLVACGGGGGLDVVSTNVVATNAVVATTAATGAAVTAGIRGAALSFPNGVPALGTTAATTLTLGSGATPAFTLVSGATTVEGITTFGSCIFTVTKSNDLTNYPIGKVITVTPCTVTANTAGLATTGNTQNVPTTLTLGQITSAAIPVATIIAPDGTISAGGVTFTVVTPVTGAGSAK